MINLLSPQTKKEIRAARLNVVLIRYCFILILSGIFVVSIFGVGFYLTQQDRAGASKLKQASEAEINKYASVKKEAEAFSSNLSNAKTILSGEIVFSKLITGIAAVLPSGVILSNLNLTSNSLGTPISLQARSASYEKAVELKNKLEASSIFEQVNIANTAQTEFTGEASDTLAKYPVSITINAVLSKPATPKPGGG